MESNQACFLYCLIASTRRRKFLRTLTIGFFLHRDIVYSDCPVKGKRRIEWSREKIAIAKRHKESQTKEFKEEYKIRSGIEATNSKLKHKHGAAKLKVRGYAQIDFAMTFKSLALNVKRMIQYILAELEQTHTNSVKNPANYITNFLASIMLIFIAFTGKNRQKHKFFLENINLVLKA